MNNNTTNRLSISEGVSSLIERNLQLANEKSKEGKKAMKLALSAIITAMDKIHKACAYMVIPEKSDFNLVNGVKRSLRIVTPVKIFTISCQFSKNVAKCSITNDQQFCLYRIVQEQISNIIKYSNATNIDIHLTCIQDSVMLEIKDYGVGCDIISQTSGIGLANIVNRVEQLCGQINIIASQEEGFLLRVTLPILKHNNL